MDFSRRIPTFLHINLNDLKPISVWNRVFPNLKPCIKFLWPVMPFRELSWALLKWMPEQPTMILGRPRRLVVRMDPTCAMLLSIPSINGWELHRPWFDDVNFKSMNGSKIIQNCPIPYI
eukprot:scaffold6898_cov123-Cylindrotheca_fusiformis.AAC.2